MGWKTLKEAFGIKHIVHVREGMIYLGSRMVSELAWINPMTGEVGHSRTFKRVVEEYPALFSAAPADLAALIQQEDNFNASNKVYTYEGADIIEKTCEEPGWPNVTHDGVLMYENTFSTNKDEVIGWAKKSAAIRIKMTGEDIERAERDIAILKARLTADESVLSTLEERYPLPPGQNQ